LISILTGIICNQWLLGRFLAPDGVISGFVTRLTIWLLELALLLVGFIVLKHRRRPMAIAIRLVILLFWALAMPALMEFGLRTTESPIHRRDRLFYQRYYNGFHEDDGYYKLLDFDPALGWRSAPNSVINYGTKDWSTRFTIDGDGLRTYPKLE